MLTIFYKFPQKSLYITGILRLDLTVSAAKLTLISAGYLVITNRKNQNLSLSTANIADEATQINQHSTERFKHIDGRSVI